MAMVHSAESSSRVRSLALLMTVACTEIASSSLPKAAVCLLLFGLTLALQRPFQKLSRVFEVVSILSCLCFARDSYSLLVSLLSIRFPAQSLLVVTFAFLPLMKSAGRVTLEQDWTICLGASLVFRIFAYHDGYAALGAVAAGYSHYESWRASRSRKPQDNDDWKQLCNALPQGVAIQAADSGRWTYCNPALCELLGALVPEMAYTKMETLKQRLQANKGKAYVDSIGGGTFADPGIHEDEDQNVEIFASVQYEDCGMSKLLDISAKSVRWNDRAVLLYTVKDVTEKQKVENLRISNIIKSRILRSLSHELRTPINCILNSLEYCKRKLAGDEESWSNINIALTNTNILLNKYNDILVSFPASLLRTSSR